MHTLDRSLLATGKPGKASGRDGEAPRLAVLSITHLTTHKTGAATAIIENLMQQMKIRLAGPKMPENELRTKLKQM